jgi:5S rRNA maturation endonuclease (ribonuclease M5)
VQDNNTAASGATTAYARLLDTLRDAGKTVKANGSHADAQCPAHDDQHPSLGISNVPGYGVLIRCRAGCENSDIVSALGLTMADLFDSRKGGRYKYSDGRIVKRTPGKKFTQSGFTQGTALYHVERITDADIVYVVEGEKDVLAVESIGGVAVSPAMGAGTKAQRWDWTPLSGRHVIVVADKDSAGAPHADDVAAQLRNVAESVVIAESAEGNDVSDHIAAGYKLADLHVISLLDKLGVTSEWLEAQEFPVLEQIVPGLIVEGVTVLAGPPKVGKSFLVGNLAIAVVSGGKALGFIDVTKRPVLVLALEDGHRRLQARYRDINDGPIPPGITFITKATPAECVSVITEYLQRYGKQKPLIILDTLGKVKQQKRSGQESYTVDYELGGRFKALADSCPGSAILIIHHTRKADAADFVDLVSGTQGIAGSVDCVVTVARKRGEHEGTLSVTERDVMENEYALLVKDGYLWGLDSTSLAGSAIRADERRDEAAEAARLRKQHGKTAIDVVALISERGHMTPTEVGFKFHMTPKAASNLLNRLFDAGFIVKAARGEYRSKRYNASMCGESEESGDSGVAGDSDADPENSVSPANSPHSSESSHSLHSSHSSDDDVVVDIESRRNTCACGAALTNPTSIKRGVCAECWIDHPRSES